MMSALAKLGAVIGLVPLAAAAWSLYQHPAMGVLLATFAWCG